MVGSNEELLAVKYTRLISHDEVAAYIRRSPSWL